MTSSSPLKIVPLILLAVLLSLSAAPSAVADEYRFRLGYNWPHLFIGQHRARTLHVDECLTDRQIWRQFRRADFENVRFLGEDRHGNPQFRFTTARERTYVTGVDRCTGRFILLRYRGNWSGGSTSPFFH